MAKYLANIAGTITEILTNLTSVGAGDSGKIPALDATGRLDSSFMPSGIGANTQTITTSEALAAGAFVNVWNSTGTKVRNADASVTGKEAHGFVLAAAASGAAATVYFSGSLNNQVTGQTPGVVYLSTTPGQATATAPSGSGQVVQRLGTAVSATAVETNLVQPIALA